MAKLDLGQRLIERGREIGRLEAKRQILLRLLRVKFGCVADGVERQVEAFDDLDRLDSLTLRILTANSIEEMGL